MDSQIGPELVLDWQIDPGFALSWKIGAVSAFSLCQSGHGKIVRRGDTSVGPHSSLVPRSLAEVSSDWLPIGF